MILKRYKSIAGLLSLLLAGVLGAVVLKRSATRTHGGFVLSSPEDGDSVNGSISLAVETDGLPAGAASVEYFFNDRLIAGPIAAPYYATWSSTAVWDGQGTISARARDAAGKVLASTAAAKITVANTRTTIQFLKPSPDLPLKGRVPVEIEVSRPRGAAVPVDGIMFFIDGKRIHVAYSAEPTGSVKANAEIDTTDWLDGKHTLYVGVHSREPGKPPIAMADMVLRFENGATVARVAPRWSTLYMVPKDTESLNVSLMQANGQTTPVTADLAYRAEHPAVATVSSSGVVTAVAPGITSIHMDYQGFRAMTRVVVTPSTGFRHFSRTGEILDQYTKDASFFPRSLYNLQPVALEYPPLVKEVKKAHVNTLEAGFFPSRTDIANMKSLDDFKRKWDPVWTKLADQSTYFGMPLLLTGDSFVRQPDDVADNIARPWIEDATSHVFKTVRDSRVAFAVEMVNDAAGVWGPTPVPNDGRWKKFAKPVDDDAFLRIMSWIDRVPKHTPITWPVQWSSGPEAVRAWIGDARFSDFGLNNWENVDWRYAYPWGLSLPQIRDGLDNVVIGRAPNLLRGQPAIQMINIAGPYYTKMGDGEEFEPGQDRLENPASRPEAITAEILYAVASAQAGVRAYAFDWDSWKGERRFSPVGSEHRPTGADGFKVGLDRWRAMANGFSLLNQIEAHLFDPPMHALYLGPTIVTGARKSANRRMLVAINFSEQAVPATVDLSPYRLSGGKMTRHRLLGESLVSEAVNSEGEAEKVTLQPGESITWISERAK